MNFEQVVQEFMNSKEFRSLSSKNQEFIKRLLDDMIKAAKKPTEELMQSIVERMEKFERAFPKAMFGGVPPIRKKFQSIFETWGELIETEGEPPEEAIGELLKEFMQWWEQSGGKDRADRSDQEKVEKLFKMMKALIKKLEDSDSPITRFSNPFMDVSNVLSELLDDPTKANHRGYRKFAKLWKELVDELGFDDRFDPLS